MPNSVLTRGRKAVARFAALAMVASIMVIGAVPASAAIDTSATCPGSADAGFTDIGTFDATTQEAINCLVAYGISNGTSATTFSPNGSVTRWQMALFLTRQAGVHGVTVPAAVDQGFTDIGSFDQATQDAINQLAQLGVSQGTSATTFSPNDNVTRWQMALFLTRLVSAAGVTLPSGAAQGFSDIGSFDAATQTAINQSAQLGIADGTSATTYAPAADTTRWQMALFLTRTAAADGVTPGTTISTFTFNPSGDVQVDSGVDQDFTVSGLTPGDTYQIALIDSNEVTVNGTVVFGDNEGTANEADNLGDEFSGSDAIDEINGVNIADDTEATATADSDGEIVVGVNSTDYEEFYIVVFADDDGDDDLDLNADNEANEDIGISGLVQILAPEAPNAFSDFVDVLAVGDGFFVGDDGADEYTFFLDSADDYEYEGTNTSAANFVAWLTVDDVIDVDTYSRSAGSTFDFDVDIPDEVEGITAVDGDFDEASGDTDANDVRVRWDDATGGSIDDYYVELYEEDSDDDTDCVDGVYAGVWLEDSDNATEGNDGLDNEVVFVDMPDDEYCAVVWAESDTGDYSDEPDDSDDAVVLVDTGETSAPEIDDLDLTTDAGVTGLLDGGDVIRFIFSEQMSGTLGDTNATYFRIADDNSVYQAACVDNGACVQSTTDDPDDTLTITLAGALQFISGTDDGVDLLDTPTVTAVSSTWDDLAGNQLDLAGSTDVTIN